MALELALKAWEGPNDEGCTNTSPVEDPPPWNPCLLLQNPALNHSTPTTY